MLKSKQSLLRPDPRNDHVVIDKTTGAQRPMAIEDIHDLMETAELKAAVPAEVREQFDLARHAFIYSWFDLSMVTLAERHSYAVLELALRTRLEMAGADVSGARGLQNLWQKAVKLKLVRAEDFEVPSSFTPGEMLSQLDILRMLRNPLSHGTMHLVPDGSLQMIRLCAEIIDKIYAIPQAAPST